LLIFCFPPPRIDPRSRVVLERALPHQTAHH
jgi:hypothetical protein